MLSLILIITPLTLLMVRGVFFINNCIVSKEVLFSIKLSLQTSIVSTIICMIFSIPTAYGLSRIKFKGNKIVMLILYLPMSLPHIISGIALLLVCGDSLIGRFLQNIGLDFVFTVKGIILAQVFVNLSFSIKILKTAIDKSSFKLEFVARTLGCSKVRTFQRVALPLIRRDILTAAIMTFSRALGEFGAIMILVGTTRMKTEVMPTAVFLNVSTGDMDTAIGVATILIIISLISMAIFEFIENKKEY
ncbi:MAG: ABC transporter permease [Clostridium sp.]